MSVQQNSEIKFPKPPKVIFTQLAWIKMTALISTQKGEIGWYGTVERTSSEDGDVYRINDILVHPQVVTGVTCSSKDCPEEYGRWQESLSDEVFNALRFDGHSHVNMGTTPSSIDNQNKEETIKRLTKDMFYIFMIWNKSYDYSLEIYDTFHEFPIKWTKENVKVEIAGIGNIEQYLDTALEHVKERKQVTSWTYQRVREYLTPANSGSEFTSSDAVPWEAHWQRTLYDWD